MSENQKQPINLSQAFDVVFRNEVDRLANHVIRESDVFRDLLDRELRSRVTRMVAAAVYDMCEKHVDVMPDGLHIHVRLK